MSYGCGDSPAAQPLDSFIRQQFDVLQTVRENMPAILKVASHLTPVEDLADFRDEVEAIYPKLGVLVEACELILQASEAGLALLHAIDVPAQRAALGLGSAALRSEDYFALASDLPNLTTQISDLDAVITLILAQLNDKATKGEVQAILDLLGDGDGLGGLGGRLDLLIDGLQNGDYFVDIMASLNTLSASVDDLDGRLVAQVAVTDDLALRVTNSETAFQAQLAAHQSLELRVQTTEQNFDIQGASITALQAHAVTANERYELQSSAMNSLSNRLTSNEGAVAAVAAETTTLNTRLVDAQEELEGQAFAMENLQARVEVTEAGMAVTSEDITQLKASLATGGNLLWNGGFEANTNGWELFSIGPDWAGPLLDRDILTSSLLPALRVRNTTAGVTPLTDTGARSVNNPVEAQESYILSGWIAAQNCTARLDYRVLDASFTVIDYGTVAFTEDAAPSTFASWPRVFKKIPIPFGGVMLQVQLWALDPSGPLPMAWLCRGMLEQASPLQENPSPWAPSAMGIQTALSEAATELRTRVEEAEGALLAQSEQITALQASISTLPTVYVQPTMPEGDAYNVGDYWFDSDDGNKQYVWDGTIWNDTAVVSGTVNYAQSTMPVGGSYNIGDQWIDTSNGNRLHRWNGSAWIDVSDARISAQGTAISELTTRVTNAENVNTSQSSALTALQNTVADPITGLATRASAGAVDALNTRVTAAENQVSAVSEDVVELSTAVNNVELDMQATANGVQQLQTTVTETQQDLELLTKTMTTRIDNILADNILSPDEKPGVILDYQAILDERAGIVAAATSYGITNELTTYQTAVDALTGYLATLTTPTMWNDVSGYTNLT